MAQCGLLPETQVTVEDVQAVAGLMFLRVGGASGAVLGSRAAEKVLVYA